MTKKDVLGAMPVAVFTNWDDAENFCELNDEYYEDPAKSVFITQPFTLNLLDGLTLEEASDLCGDTEDYDDDDDEDY